MASTVAAGRFLTMQIPHNGNGEMIIGGDEAEMNNDLRMSSDTSAAADQHPMSGMPIPPLR
jgi:hypothetical protein